MSRRGFLRKNGAKPLDIVCGRCVVFFQTDQRVAVLRTNGAGILIGHVNAAVGQPNIVDNIVDLSGRNDLTHCLLNLVK
jgi:hypothetical protein